MPFFAYTIENSAWQINSGSATRVKASDQINQSVFYDGLIHGSGAAFVLLLIQVPRDRTGVIRPGARRTGRLHVFGFFFFVVLWSLFWTMLSNSLFTRMA